VKAGLGSLRSSAFLGVFVIIYQSGFLRFHVLPGREPDAFPHQPYSATNTTSTNTLLSSKAPFLPTPSEPSRSP
jgi:hypothetical protein